MVVFLLLSIILYLFAPKEYSLNYCVCLMVVFLLNFGYALWKDRKIEKIGFMVFFSISLFMESYLYPIFVYPVVPEYSLFKFSIDYSLIPKSTALVNLCYLSFLCSYLNKKYFNISNFYGNNINLNKYYKISYLDRISLNKIYYLMILVLCLSLLFDGVNFFSGQYNEDIDSSNNRFGYIWVFLSTFILFASIIEIKLNDTKLRLIIFITVLFIGLLGSRTIAMCVVSIYFVAYTYRYKLTFAKIFIYSLPIFILFACVGYIRSGMFMDEDREIGILALFRDFIVVNRDLYSLYDYANHYGINYGISFMGHILSVIPFGQSIFSYLFGVESHDLRTDTLVSYIDGAGESLGLGTHLVGDVYVAFGLFGCFLLFYLLGHFVAYNRNKMFNGSDLGYIVYYVMVSGAIFMTRSGLFYCFKNVVWGIVFYGLFSSNAFWGINKYIKSKS